jgi:hypothetical protein
MHMSGNSVAAAVRRQILASADRFWRPDDFDGSPGAVAQALSRLAATGDLRRIRRGLYWRGASTLLGMAPPPPERLADEVAGGAGTGPAEWSAALMLGLTTQVAREDTIAVTGRTPRNTGSVRIVSRAGSTKRRDERLSPAEVALLEVLREWDVLVELPAEDAVGRIAGLADDGLVRLDRVARASATEPPRVRERLRRLLRALGRTAMADAVRPARSESVHRDLVLAGQRSRAFATATNSALP